MDPYLQALMQSFGAGQPYGTRGYPNNLPSRDYAPPGGSFRGLPGATYGQPSMGYPGMGGPEIIPPQYSPIPPMKSVGPFTGGVSTEGAYAPPTIDNITPDALPWWMRAARGGPLGALAAIMNPSPAETGELPLSQSGARPTHPPSTGTMPPLTKAGAIPGGVVSPMTLDQARIASYRQPAGPLAAISPTATAAYNPPMPPPRPAPAQTTKPAKKQRIDPKTIDLGMNPNFTTFQYRVPSGRGPLANNPIYTALNLGGKA